MKILSTINCPLCNKVYHRKTPITLHLKRFHGLSKEEAAELMLQFKDNHQR